MEVDGAFAPGPTGVNGKQSCRVMGRGGCCACGLTEKVLSWWLDGMGNGPGLWEIPGIQAKA